MKYRVIGLLTVIAVLASFSAAQGEIFEADYLPWSGYWWPYSSGTIVKGFNGHLSPLEKYDLVTTGNKYGPARSYGMRYYYDPDAVSWGGMCYFWAAASILEPEPVHKGLYKDVIFDVGDKKALLTAAYDTTIYESYSVRKPEDFHQVLSEFIAHQKKPIIFDIGTDGEHWNFPVFKYETDYILEGSRRHYTTTIYYASDGVRPDYVGTLVKDTTYEYYFDLDGDQVVDSGWEGDSKGNEPLKAFEPFAPAPRNKKYSYAEVRKIVKTDDDGFENNDRFYDAAFLNTGSYDLLAIDDDFFAMDLRAGDRPRIKAVSAFGDELKFRWYSPDLILLNEMDYLSEFEFTAFQEGTYYLSVVPDHPEDELEYHLDIDLALAYQAFFPLEPTGLWANGLSVSMLDAAGGRVFLSGINQDGTSRYSYSDNMTGYSSILGTNSSLNLTEPDNGYLRLDSDAYCMGLQIPTDGEYLMLGTNLIADQNAGSEIFFPHMARKNGWQTYFGLINTGNQDETVIRNAFDRDGHLVGSDTIELSPGQKIENDARNIRALAAEAVSMQALTASGNDCLVGYITFLNPFSARGRALISLNKNSEDNNSLVIPHVLSGSGWWTGIAVMNTGIGNNEIYCSAYNSGGQEVSSKQYVLAEMGNLVIEAGNMFDDVPAEDIASIRILSLNDNSFSGLVIFGNKNKKQLAGMPIRPANESMIYAPHVAESGLWWTEIGLMNAGNEEDSVSITAFNAAGELIAERVHVLQPNQCLAGSVTHIFQEDLQLCESIKYLKAESFSGQPISGLYLIGSQDGNRLMGDVFVSGD